MTIDLTELNPVTITLGCVLKGRYVDEHELWGKYQAACTKHRVLPLWGQLRTALGTLKTAGLIGYVRGKGVRKV